MSKRVFLFLMAIGFSCPLFCPKKRSIYKAGHMRGINEWCNSRQKQLKKREAPKPQPHVLGANQVKDEQRVNCFKRRPSWEMTLRELAFQETGIRWD